MVLSIQDWPRVKILTPRHLCENHYSFPLQPPLAYGRAYMSRVLPFAASLWTGMSRGAVERVPTCRALLPAV